MSPTPEIKGWCPTTHRPMPSNDGLLIRAKVIGSRIAAGQLAAIAAISADCGNGLVDLSQRAQLQLRGVSDATLAEARRRLGAAGLLPSDAFAERVTNIVASPLAGLEARAAFDSNALARDLARALQADERLRALPAKFLFAIDGGGDLAIDDIDADIRIQGAAEGRVAVRAAGAPDRAVIVDERDAVVTAVRLAHAFIALRGEDFELRRMSRLIAVLGYDALLHEARLAAQNHEQRASARSDFLGARETGDVCFAGVAAPSGRWRAQELSELAEIAAAHGRGELRLTPWRAFLLPAQTPDAAQRMIATARILDLIVSHDDPRLALVACPGAPECPQAQGETRTHLARLAPLAQKLAGRDGVGLHVSGCAKGCARPGAAPVTLVANGGLFNLIENGRASDAPLLQGLDIDAVERALSTRAKEPTCPTP
ncbi:MAG: precorrin-3B synthase [Methylocystis sp.]|nr:MAG: precorrin-3B synthase [Methylocystis sp.]